MKRIDKAVELSTRVTKNVFKKNLTRFAAVLLAVLAGLVAGPNAALDAALQHRDQVPGFYRLKVGDLEVTALYDGTGVFDSHWLNGTKATMNGVVNGLQEDPHMLDVVDSGFLVNTGKQLKVGASLDASTAVDFTKNYLLAFEEELKKAKDPDSLIKAMRERFPSADRLLAIERGAKANVKPRQTN